MRIAVTGTHGVGKTTLIDDFLAAHPDYTHEQEPYWALAQDGVVFADGPNLADLEEQLARSIAMVLEPRRETRIVFDRSPLDFIAYLEVVSVREGASWSPGGKLLRRIGEAVRSLDLLAFVPLSQPDEIAAKIEYPRLRLAVDRELKSMLRDDTLGLFSGRAPRIVEIQGSRSRRVELLSAAIGPV